MKSLWIKFILVAALSVAGNYLCTAQTPEELYQKGLMKEEGEGALQDAIKLYSQIADNSDADQSLRAKALLHIGLCYEKMGTEEAVKAYQRIVDNFPTQKNEVAIARERLSSLLPIAEKASVTTPELSFRKLEIPTKPGNGVLSPNGKKIAYIADNALWSVPVQGKTKPGIAGEPIRLSESLEAWDLANMGIVWSANSQWLAFYASENREDVIYVVSANGGKPVKVDLDQQGLDIRGYDYRMSISPDGKILSLVNRDDNNMPFIYTISTQGGTQNRLTGSGTREPAFSPDGEFIAYVKTKPTNNLGNEIWVIPSLGGEPVLISDNADVVKSPIWSPDGSMIAFLARKYEKGWANNSNELWIAALDKKRKPTGVITKTELDHPTTSMLAGWSSDNKIGFWLSEPDKNFLYTVPSTGGQAMQITSKNSWMPCFSPDGKHLYFDGINTNRFAGVEYVPVTGGDVVRIPISVKETIQPAMPTGGISVSPDGQKIVFASYYNNNVDNSPIQKKPEGFHHIITIPVKGGIPVQLTTNSLVDGYPVWSPDGRYIAFVRHEKKTENNEIKSFANIYTIDAAGGTPVRVTSVNDKVTKGRIDWSQDGKWIGFFSADNTIKTIPAEGGKSKVVVNGVDANSHFGLSFSPEGNNIAYSNKEKIYVVDINNGNTEEIKTGLNAIPTMPSWSPVGGKIAFCAYHKGETDLWFLENFLPIEKLPQYQESELAGKPEGIRIKQVWKKPYLDFLGSVSSDGRLLSYIDWGQGDVAVHNLVTGEDRVLIHEANLEASPESFAQSPKISKDGSQIAYFWWNPYHTFDLRLTDVNNPSSQLIYKEEGVEVYPADWLSDQELITYRQNRNTDKTSISLFNVSDGTYLDLKKFEGRTWAQIATSPDEKYVAYDFKNRISDGNYDINLLPVDGSGEISLISHPANDKVLGWDPKNNVFLFISDRSGDWDLWALPVNEGNPGGPAKRLYTGIGEVEPMGFTENGDCYSGFSKRYFNTSVAPFNSLTGEIQEDSGVSLEGSNFWLTWSPDGQSLAYIKEDRDADTPWQLTIKDLKTGEERRLGKNLHAEVPTWSPDGNSILFKGRIVNKSRTKGYMGDIYLVNVETGQTEEILTLSDYEINLPEDDSPPLSALSWSPDGKSIFMLFYKDRLIKHDLRTGKDEIIFEHSNFEPYILQFSPDGNTLLFGTQNNGEKSRLFTMPAKGGEVVELCSAQEAEDFVSASWSPDGKYIYFSERPEETNLWRIPAKGGKPQKVWHSENRTSVYRIHPDGNQIGISQRVRTTEVRVIENLSSEITRVFNKIE